MSISRRALDERALSRFCKRWRVRVLSLFGSALRDDFGPESDVDVLIEFADDAEWTLLHLGRMKRELEDIFGREVDLLTRGGVDACRNKLRRDAILSSAQVIYAA